MKNAIERPLSPTVRTIYLIKQTENIVRFRLYQQLSQYDITGIQYTALSYLNRPNPLSSAQLSRRLHISPQSANEIVNTLAEKNLIQRFEDPENRRILRIKLTEKGKQLLEACDTIVDELEEEIFSVLSETELSTIRNGLNKVINQFSRID